MSDKPIYKPGSNIVRTLVGASLILLGVLFLIGRYVGARFDIDFGHYTWPLFIITPGLLLFMASFAFERQTGITLAIFGGMLAMTGTILLVQNTFELYATWAYAWALVAPTSIGLAKLVYGVLLSMISITWTVTRHIGARRYYAVHPLINRGLLDFKTNLTQ
jgi:hypothetical protein